MIVGSFAASSKNSTKIHLVSGGPLTPLEMGFSAVILVPFLIVTLLVLNHFVRVSYKLFKNRKR